LGFVVAALSCARFSPAQPMPNGPFQTHQISSNVYWVEGGGGNCGVIIGDKGVIVVDAKTSADGGKELLADIAKITPKPVTTVIITHRDMDHIGGLSAFPKGIEIIAHQVDAGFEAPMPPNMPHPTVVPPTRVLAENKVDLDIDHVKLQLLHWAPAHTSGDTIVYLPTEKIVFAGDILDSGFRAGHIHFDQHGSSAGWIETVKGMAALDSNLYVPGHGNIENKQAVEAHLNNAETERAQVQKLVDQGKSLAEIRDAIGDPPQNKGNGPGNDAFPAVVYREITGKTQ
jgi:glyoxylase-like metal-dependent hydrolase (beta-lactamase superfamily II)